MKRLFQSVFLPVLLCFLLTETSSQTERAAVSPSGFKLEWLEKGNGNNPQAGDRVFFHVQYSINDSVAFDSRMMGDTPSIDLPEPNDPKIAGEPLFELLHIMVPGDVVVVSQTKTQMNQPLAGMKADDEFRTMIELLEYKSAEDYEAELQAIRDREPEVREFVESVWWKYVSGEYGDELVQTESGIKFIIHQKGSGPPINPGDRISLHYYGKIIESARNFDNSYLRAREFILEVGAGTVIQGWEEVLPLFNRGDIVSVFIPWSLAYGERGRPPLIPGKSDLLFYFEISP